MDEAAAAGILLGISGPWIAEILTGFHHELEIRERHALLRVREQDAFARAVLGEKNRLAVLDRVGRHLVVALGIAGLRVAHGPIHLVLAAVLCPLVAQAHGQLDARVGGQAGESLQVHLEASTRIGRLIAGVEFGVAVVSSIEETADGRVNASLTRFQDDRNGFKRRPFTFHRIDIEFKRTALAAQLRPIDLHRIIDVGLVLQRARCDLDPESRRMEGDVVGIPEHDDRVDAELVIEGAGRGRGDAPGGEHHHQARDDGSATDAVIIEVISMPVEVDVRLPGGTPQARALEGKRLAIRRRLIPATAVELIVLVKFIP